MIATAATSRTRPILFFRIKAALFCCVLCLPFALAQANQTVYLQMVTVGDAGNAADTNGYGAVAYTYRCGKLLVTKSQYAAFLNAVGAADTYALYDTNMTSDLNIAGIGRSGSSGTHTYSVIGSGNQPIGFVSWFRAARFANWMHNGQPTGAQTAATTEQGAYALNGATNGIILKNAGAQYWVPTGNEWYKAAYYDRSLASGTGGYWLYPTRSNVAPGNTIGAAANQANIYVNGIGFSVTQSPTYSNSQNYLTDVGAYSGSASYYGTFDQGGDVLQWNDDVLAGSKRGLRGGSWPGGAGFLLSSYNPGYSPTNYHQDYGFRLATIPAPEFGSNDAVALQISISAGSVKLTLKASVQGRTYQLQIRDDLAGANWQDSGLAQTGTGQDLIISTPFDPAMSHRFYRLRLS